MLTSQEKYFGKYYINILVYGFYGKNNLGDELFKEAFSNLFPNYSFTFTDIINKQNLENKSTIFIGGGSFLYDKINISNEDYKILQEKNIFYIGIGAETEISVQHKQLLSLAKLIAIRSNHIDKIKLINKNVIKIPDLVYSLKTNINYKNNKSIIIFPNILTVPKWDDPAWKTFSWEYFKSEFAQFLEELPKEYNYKFLPMSLDNKIYDIGASTEIINKLKEPNYDYQITNYKQDFNTATSIISEFSYAISQRFHGIVLSEMLNIPCLSIYHHDKMKVGNNILSFYEASKSNLMNGFNSLHSSLTKSNSFGSEDFLDLQEKINNILLG